MDPSAALGNPLLVVGFTSLTVMYTSAVAWMTYVIYRTSPELLQVQLFRKLRALRNSVLFMGLGLVVGLVFLTLFMGDVTLPDAVWAAGGILAAILFWYGMVGYSNVFRVPHERFRRT